jgi:hypothetical protein
LLPFTHHLSLVTVYLSPITVHLSIEITGVFVVLVTCKSQLFELQAGSDTFESYDSDESFSGGNGFGFAADSGRNDYFAGARPNAETAGPSFRQYISIA